MTNYDYMPETFATREEQRNNFVFDEEKEKYEKKARSVDQGRTSAYFLCFKIFDTFQ